MPQLIQTALTYGVDEMALPDVLQHHPQTLSRARNFFRVWHHRLTAKTKLGFVLHGHSLYDTLGNFDQLRLEPWYRMIDTIYLPRSLVTQMNKTTRIGVAQALLTSPGFDKAIHFFGASPYFISEAHYIRPELMKHIRSMDTSAPFVYALENESVDQGAQCRRDVATYFSERLIDPQKQLARNNMALMDRWAV